jgi:enterochelin esterase-like enzyme
MGGMEALSLGFSMLDHFNYIGAFSPAPTLDTSLLTLSGSKYTPQLVMINCGDADTMVGEVAKSYHDTLTTNGVDHIWYLFPGGKHEEKVWKNGLINFLQRIFR